MLVACSQRCRLSAHRAGRRRAARRRCWRVALPVDAVVRCRENVVDLAERSDGLVEVQAERGEVVDRGVRHGPPRTDGGYSEAVRKVPSSLVVGGGRCDPVEDGCVRVRGVGEPELVLVTLLAHLAPQVGATREGELDGRVLRSMVTTAGCWLSRC